MMQRQVSMIREVKWWMCENERESERESESTVPLNQGNNDTVSSHWSTTELSNFKLYV